jgi:hypothetical protein
MRAKYKDLSEDGGRYNLTCRIAINECEIFLLIEEKWAFQFNFSSMFIPRNFVEVICEMH